MSPRGPSPELLVPLERLHRRDPLREWSVVVPAAGLAGDGPELRVADVSVSPGARVAVEVVLDQVSEGVMVTGTVTCTWSGPCARCLHRVEGDAVAEVGELFETVPEEGESYPLGEEVLDLTPMVRDAVLLELPIAAVRCPFPEPCEHLPDELRQPPDDEDEAEDPTSAQTGDPRWAALDELVFDDD